MDGLAAMINGKVVVTINESDTNTVLASAMLDELWGFAIGRNSWSAEGVSLTPAASVPEGMPKVKAASLSSVSIQLQQRQAPAGVDAAVVPPEGTALPPLQPYSFISEELASKCNMVELSVTELTPVPASLHAASDAAGGKLSVSLGLQLPGGGPAVVAQLGCAGGALAVPAVRRELMLPEACVALQHALEDGLAVAGEVARYVAAEGFGDPAWEAYHAGLTAEVGAQLLVAGATEAAVPVALQPFAASGAKAFLPPYVAPAGKAKPVEEAPAGGASAWATAGTRAAIKLRFARPIVAPWSPPPKPERPLLELIPARDLSPKVEPTTATDDFKAQVASIAKALAAEYKAAFPGAPASAPGTAAEAVESRHKALVFDLNRSGKYLQLKDSLKSAVVAIVKEKYRKSGTMSPNEMALLYNDLYTHLLGAVHASLNSLAGAAGRQAKAAPAPEPVPDHAELAKLLDLAGQAEAAGNAARAEALHQRRLLAKTSAQVWYDYGAYCLRRGHAGRGRGEQCFREALALEPTHRGALLALLGCSVAEGRATDPQYLQTAEATAHRLLEVEGSASLGPWAAMALVYKAGGDAKRSELASCEQELGRLERALSASADAGAQGGHLAKAFVELAMQLLDTLALPSEALLALDMAAGLRHWPAAGEATHTAHALGVALCEEALGRGAALLAAGPALHKLVREAGPRAQLLAADLYRGQGQVLDAVRYFQQYVEAARSAGTQQAVPLRVWVQLAGCYTTRGEPGYAADVCMLGTSAAPGCALLWRSAGEAFLSAGDLRSADMALTEANVLDPEDPLTWGLLALIALREGRTGDGDKALSYALRCGLDDAGVLLGVAEEYRGAGLLRQQQGVLQEVVARLLPDSCGVRVLLARSLVAQRAAGAAAPHVAAAKAMAVADEDAAAVAELEAQLAGMAAA